MKDKAVGHIANKLNISKATASKAIRHCSGVDSETRQNVLDEIRIINYRPQSECDIYAIIPDTPQYFWKEIRQGIRLGKTSYHIPVKCNVYTNLRDEDAVLSYLDEAEHLNARAIIIAARITPKIHDKLASLVERRLVLFLSENHHLANTFFVGGDTYQDGFSMGKKYVSTYADRKLILLSNPNNKNTQKRLEGFQHAVEEENKNLMRNATHINVDKKILKDPKLLPSKLAPLLLEAAKDSNSLCIYSTFGLSQMPLVITKAKLGNKVVCMCHDYFSEKKDSCIKIICNQDVVEQGKTAVKLAAHYVKEHNYPDEKATMIPSILEIL